MAMPAATRQRLPIVHPAALLAIAVLVANDHVLKDAWPGWLTGKLSDFAGLTFFPLLLVSICSLVRPPGAVADIVRRTWICSATTALVFSLIKTWPAAADAYRVVLGTL